MLSARSLTLSWDEGASFVVKDLSLDVFDGEVVAVVGRSGTGKTTLLHAIAGLSQPYAGEIVLNGSNITGKAGYVSYMLQKDLLLPSKRVIDNVCLPLSLRGMSRERAYEKAQPFIERFGLLGLEHSWPHELSGGQRQRAAFLRTYLMGREFMLLDEPFSALDAITRSELRSWFVDMSHELGMSALIITHDVDEALLCAERVLVLSGTPSLGVASSFVAEIVAREKGESVQSFAYTQRYVQAKEKLLSLL